MKRDMITSRPLHYDCRKISIIYLIIGLSAVLCNIWFSPISVIPDEPNHFARALQISEGVFYSKRVAPTDSGGYFPAEMMRVLHAYDDINFHADQRISPERLAFVKQNGWGGPVKYFGIANTAVNPPLVLSRRGGWNLAWQDFPFLGFHHFHAGAGFDRSSRRHAHNLGDRALSQGDALPRGAGLHAHDLASFSGVAHRMPC